MSAKEFWEDDPQLFASYRTFFINKKKRELEEFDYKCWLQGLYIHDGNGKLVTSLKQTLGNMFCSSKDHSKIDTYPTKPYTELEREKKIDAKQKLKKQSYEDYQNSFIFFGTMKQRYIDNIKNRKGE